MSNTQHPLVQFCMDNDNHNWKKDDIERTIQDKKSMEAYLMFRLPSHTEDPVQVDVESVRAKRAMRRLIKRGYVVSFSKNMFRRTKFGDGMMIYQFGETTQERAEARKVIEKVATESVDRVKQHDDTGFGIKDFIKGAMSKAFNTIMMKKRKEENNAAVV